MSATTCAAGAPCTITLTFGPSAAGVQSARLELADASTTRLAALALVGTAVQAQANPTPSIASISPTSVTRGSTNITLSVSGSRFTTTSQVHLTDTDPTTQQVMDTPLSTTTTSAAAGTLTATLATAPPDTALVTVANPGAPASTPFGPLFVVAAGATCGSACTTASAVDTVGSTPQPVKLPGCCNLLATGTGTVSIAQYTPAGATGVPAFRVGNTVFDLTGTASANGLSIPFSKTFEF